MLKGHFTTYSFADTQYQLYSPDTEDLQNEWNNGTLKNFPYWGKCWPAAVALSAFMVKNTALIQDKQVLELAAGLGLPSLVAASYAKKITCSDYLPEPLSFVEISATENGICNIETRIINWHNIPKDLLADVVLLSDVNYDPESFDALDQLFSFFLELGTSIILSTPQRIMAKSFIEKWLPFAILQEAYMMEEEVMVTVLVLKKLERRED